MVKKYEDKERGEEFMKAVVCEKPNEFSIKDINRPTLHTGNALIRVKRIGICGTDYHAYQGNQPYFKYPRVFGHELAGIIEEIGDNDKGLKKGDQVTILPYMHCGDCIACRNGKTNCCLKLQVFGVHVDGGMQEFISVPISHILKTEGLTLDQTAIIEPFSIGAHAISRSGITKGENVLVIGAGPIGIGVMMFAQLKGAKVIAMDIDEKRLSFCSEWAKVEGTVNALHEPETIIQEMLDGDHPTTVFDASGNKKSMNESIQYVSHGGKLIFVGLMNDYISFYNPYFHEKELTLMASRNSTQTDFENVMKQLRIGNIDIEGYISHRCFFDQVTDRFNYWLRPESKVVKALIEL